MDFKTSQGSPERISNSGNTLIRYMKKENQDITKDIDYLNNKKIETYTCESIYDFLVDF